MKPKPSRLIAALILLAAPTAQAQFTALTNFTHGNNVLVTIGVPVNEATVANDFTTKVRDGTTQLNRAAAQ
jgi:hypothetical protein